MILALGALGVLTMFLLRPMPDETEPRPTATKVSAARPWQACLDGLVLLKRLPVLMLAPMFFWTGFELAFVTGEFTTLFKSDTIGLVLAFFGGAEVLGSWVVGPASDRIGRSVVLVAGGTLFYALALAGTGVLASNHPPELPELGGVSALAYLCAVAFGLADCAFNTQVYAIMGEVLPASYVGGFAQFQLFQNVGSAVGFFYSIGLPVHGENGTFTQLYVQVGVLLISTGKAVDRFGNARC